MLRQWFRDWWRGWSDADLASVRVKMASPKKPGEVSWLTAREWRAFVANDPLLGI